MVNASKSFSLSFMFATVDVTVGFITIICPILSSVISGIETTLVVVAAAVVDVPYPITGIEETGSDPPFAEIIVLDVVVFEI